MATENNQTPNGERDEDDASLVPASSDEGGRIEVDDSDSSAPSEMLDKIPAGQRSTFVRSISSSFAQFIAPAINPIFEKVTSAHISTIIENAENERVRENEADKSRRLYQFAYFLIGLLAIIGLVVFFTLTDNRDLIAAIITGALGFLGGLAAGRYTRRN